MRPTLHARGSHPSTQYISTGQISVPRLVVLPEPHFRPAVQLMVGGLKEPGGHTLRPTSQAMGSSPSRQYLRYGTTKQTGIIVLALLQRA